MRPFLWQITVNYEVFRIPIQYPKVSHTSSPKNWAYYLPTYSLKSPQGYSPLVVILWKFKKECTKTWPRDCCHGSIDFDCQIGSEDFSNFFKNSSVGVSGNYPQPFSSQLSINLLILSDPGKAAVVLVTSLLVLHACVNDAPYWDVYIVRAEVLQQIHYLLTLGLQKDIPHKNIRTHNFTSAILIEWALISY